MLRQSVIILAVVLTFAFAPGVGAARGPGGLALRVKVGDTPVQVRSVLGTKYSVCTLRSSRLCRDPVRLYEYVSDGSKSLAVRFHAGRVVAVFRLGAVTGYR